MSNNHFTTKIIWVLSRCYIATSNNFFHNLSTAMQYCSHPRAKRIKVYAILLLYFEKEFIFTSWIYKDESLNKSSFYLTLILV